MTTPTARSLKLMRACGYQCATVESWNHHVGDIKCQACKARVGVRMDLWGFADLLCVSPLRTPHMVLIQVTTAGHVSDRLEKACGKAELRTWLRTPGAAFWVQGWAGAELIRQVEVRAEDLRGVEIVPKRPRRKKSTQKELFP